MTLWRGSPACILTDSFARRRGPPCLSDGTVFQVRTQSWRSQGTFSRSPSQQRKACFPGSPCRPLLLSDWLAGSCLPASRHREGEETTTAATGVGWAGSTSPSGTQRRDSVGEEDEAVGITVLMTGWDCMAHSARPAAVAWGSRPRLNSQTQWASPCTTLRLKERQGVGNSKHAYQQDRSPRGP